MILYVEQQPFRVYFREHGETWGPGLGRDMGACWGERSYSGTSETNPRAQARPFPAHQGPRAYVDEHNSSQKQCCLSQICVFFSNLETPNLLSLTVGTSGNHREPYRSLGICKTCEHQRCLLGKRWHAARSMTCGHQGGLRNRR